MNVLLDGVDGRGKRTMDTRRVRPAGWNYEQERGQTSDGAIDMTKWMMDTKDWQTDRQTDR